VNRRKSREEDSAAAAREHQDCKDAKCRQHAAPAAGAGGSGLVPRRLFGGSNL
jgi:hypothetical protein